MLTTPHDRTRPMRRNQLWRSLDTSQVPPTARRSTRQTRFYDEPRAAEAPSAGSDLTPIRPTSLFAR